ncbi:MAG: adenine deaminase, partial [Candidatus Micrarchaeota archaeon]|nr:adenine deaminase [Candidatus Micrarchaeota archaeon]
MKTIEGNLVDVKKGIVYPAKVYFDKRIRKIEKSPKFYKRFILPGLIDAHIHIESTLLCPSRFAEKVIPHGTVGTISDPHEIANIAGIKGIEYMISDTPKHLKTHYTAPSCVPASPFETSGTTLGSHEIAELLGKRKVLALGEVMNFPAVIAREKDMMKKIAAARRAKKRIDGHAPLLSGEGLKKYVSAGIETDHEVVSYEEGKEKIKAGLKIMIREGSSERNMKDLIGLAREYPVSCFFASDDRLPQDMRKGHMDYLIRRAVELGLDPITAIKCCTINPAKHYGIDTGIIEIGAAADFVVVGDLKKMNVQETWIDGEMIAKDGKYLPDVKPKKFPLLIKNYPLKEDDFII